MTMPPTEHADLLVIGGGSGGIACAIRAARHGARVILFEPRELGGTCVNRGCVPKKAMWLAAELAEAQRIAVAVGFNSAPGALDWKRFVAHREAYVARSRASYGQRFAQLGIRVVAAAARLAGAGVVHADGINYHTPHILLATGARPRPLAVPGAERAIDSDGFFALDTCPERVAVLGGGYIGVELGGVLAALGSRVSLFPRSRLLSRFDAELGAWLTEAMRGRGIEVRENFALARLDGKPGAVFVHGKDASRHGPFDVVLAATGRIPNVEDVGLEAAGVALDARGFIATDAFENTSVDGIHAVGDVNGKIELTPVAIAAGRALAERLFGGQPDARLDYRDVPSVVFSHPPIGSVGLSEADARAQHGDAVRVRHSAFKPMLWSLAGSEERMHLKLVCVGEDERIVGLHGIGPGIDEILQGFAVALRMGARYADFQRTVAIHPTAAEEFVTMG
ncbi:MAG TPA: glutathione-disulfide reductase [Rhodanobacteraceae bacterium]|nr:glutathione-disulfide reductase [Rhodanobacteraceae bacterium]